MSIRPTTSGPRPMATTSPCARKGRGCATSWLSSSTIGDGGLNIHELDEFTRRADQGRRSASDARLEVGFPRRGEEAPPMVVEAGAIERHQRDTDRQTARRAHHRLRTCGGLVHLDLGAVVKLDHRQPDRWQFTDRAGVVAEHLLEELKGCGQIGRALRDDEAPADEGLRHCEVWPGFGDPGEVQPLAGRALRLHRLEVTVGWHEAWRMGDLEG